MSRTSIPLNEIKSGSDEGASVRTTTISNPTSDKTVRIGLLAVSQDSGSGAISSCIVRSKTSARVIFRFSATAVPRHMPPMHLGFEFAGDKGDDVEIVTTTVSGNAQVNYSYIIWGF